MLSARGFPEMNDRKTQMIKNVFDADRSTHSYDLREDHWAADGYPAYLETPDGR
jgi:hypothetical protein